MPMVLQHWMMNEYAYATLVGVQRFALLYITLYIPLYFIHNTYLWVSLAYASLAIGGFLGYMVGFRRIYTLPMAALAVLSLYNSAALIPLLGFIGMLHSIIIPNAYVVYGNRGVAKSYTSSTIAYLASGVAIYFLRTSALALVVLLLALLPDINRGIRRSASYMVSFVANAEFISIIPFTVATFIVGGLYTVYLSTVNLLGQYNRVALALSAVLMGTLRWISDRIADKSLWASTALSAVSFIAFTKYPSLATALAFISSFSLIYPLVTMSAGKRGKDPVTSINAAFAGTSTGESIMPTLFRYNTYLVYAFAVLLVVLSLLMLLLGDRLDKAAEKVRGWVNARLAQRYLNSQ